MRLIVKILLFPMILSLGSCKKYLDEKPRQDLYVPSAVADLQALLDNTEVLNLGAFGNSLIELVADDYYVNYVNWQSADLNQRQNYIWGNEAYDFGNWANPYIKSVYTSNVVLEHLEKAKKEDYVGQKQYVEGSALFYRAFAFYQLAQLYCKPYSVSAESDMGIVLRQTADVEAKSVRATVTETYNRITTDLKRAAELLPEKSGYVTRPDKTAAYAMLARVYLNMRDYENALKFTDLALASNNKLLDFNDLVALPIFTRNPEIIFFSTLSSSSLTQPGVAKIDADLYNSYTTDDIRKTMFFLQNTGVNISTYRFRGSYYTLFPSGVFNGLTTAELYLIKSECLARKGEALEAMHTLNDLLKNRYQKNSFVELTEGNAVEAKKVILAERRKELIFRGQRWSDLRRLNLEGANITLKRVLNGQTYTLPSNDPRWVMLIPLDEINRSGIPQNPR